MSWRALLPGCLVHDVGNPWPRYRILSRHPDALWICVVPEEGYPPQAPQRMRVAADGYVQREGSKGMPLLLVPVMDDAATRLLHEHVPAGPHGATDGR